MRRPLGAVLRLGRSEPLLLLALAVGFALRVYQLPDQIPGDDEWHAIHAAVYATYSWILTHFGVADYCIPLSLFYKAMADTTGLSEVVMRAPALAFGMATLLACPLLIRARFGRVTSDLLAWLLAISPLHVYFSRYARPYAITLFLAFVGMVAFFEWWTGRGRRWAALYAACAVLGPYFHLTVLPVLLAPFLFGFLDRMLRRDPAGTRSLPELAGLAGLVAAGLLALLLAPVVTDWGALSGKLAKHRLEWATVRGAIELQLGTGRPWLLAPLGAVALVGAVAGVRRQPRWLAYLGFLGACQVAVAATTQAASISVPITLARYALPVLPLLLLALAVGLVAIEDAARSRVHRFPPGLLGAVACGVLLYYGPLPLIYYRPNSWTNHAMFQYGYDPSGNWLSELLRPPRVPPFYHRLSALPPESVHLVEAPWYYEWHNNPFPHYQRLHRQRMSVGFVGDVPWGTRAGEIPAARDGFAFRNFVHVFDHATLLRRGVRYVLFHTDLLAELPRGWPHAGSVDVAPWVEHYRSVYGAPVYEDPRVVVFDVTRPHVPARPAATPESASGLRTPDTRTPGAGRSTR